MQFRLKVVTTALTAAAAIIGATAAVNAACTLPGKWKLQTFVTSGACPKCFNANTCTITIDGEGDITGTCTVYHLDMATSTGDIAGNFKVNARCELSGKHGSPGFEDVTVRGHINGNSGTAIGTRGPASRPTNVRLINLSKY